MRSEVGGIVRIAVGTVMACVTFIGSVCLDLMVLGRRAGPEVVVSVIMAEGAFVVVQHAYQLNMAI